MSLIEAGGTVAHWLPETQLPLLEGTIGDALRRNAARWGERPALIWQGQNGIEKLTYGELLAEAEKYARWLLERMKPGDRVAFWSVNRPEYAVLLYASALAGTIATPFNPGWTDAETQHAVELTSPKLIFSGLDRRGISLTPRAEALARCPVVEFDDVLSLQPKDAARELPDFGSSHTYLIQFTSGTTGRAKGAQLSHRAALIGGWLAMHVADPDETDIWLSPSPFHHIGGSVSLLLGTLAAGGANVIVARVDANTVVSMLQTVKPTRIACVPTIFFDLLRHPELPEQFSVRVMGVGGASVPAALVRELEARTGGVVAIVYGQSECPVVTATTPLDSVVTKTETVGRPVAHIEVKIVDTASGKTLQCGEVGEICVRGPMIMDGYWNNPAATASTIDADGFLHTGDLASMAPDGVCKIHGRARDVIIRGGENIYPIEVEDVLAQHASVDTVAVVGVPDDRLGQQVAAVVKLKPGERTDPKELATLAGEFVSHFKVPTRWLFVEELPMTASGKVRKVELPALFARNGA